MNVFLIGAGNVAWHLSTALHAQDIRFMGVFNRTKEHAVELADALGCVVCPSLQEAPKNADLYLICTSDNSIAAVSAALPDNDGMVVHVSGSTSIDNIDRKHHRRGVFYPLQTFNKNRPIDFRNIPIAIEATTEEDTGLLMDVGRRLSETVVRMDGTQREALHVAAVFASNFTNYLYALSAYILQNNNLDFRLMLPLISETAKRVSETNHPMMVQTGPAIRNDVDTIQRHLSFLEQKPELRELYYIITEAIRKRQL